MPGIAWLAMHPPRVDLFPWWTGYMLDGMIAVGCAMIAWMLGTIATDIWRDRRR